MCAVAEWWSAGGDGTGKRWRVCAWNSRPASSLRAGGGWLRIQTTMPVSQQQLSLSRATRVVILGGGFGGRYAAERLALRLPAGSLITLVDRNPFLLYTPMLTEAAGGAVRPEHIVAPSGRLRRVRFVQAEITGADLKAKTVALSTGETLAADHVLLALGSTTNFRGIAGAQEHSITMKTVTDAEKLHDQALHALAQAGRTAEAAERRRLLTFVVAGGGYTGVESMAALRELLHAAAPLHGVRPEELRLVLVEPSDGLMSEMPASLGEYGKQVLERDGVDVRLKVAVKSVDATSLALSDGETLPFGTLLWDTGILPNPLLQTIECPRGKHGGITTDSCFQVTGLPGVWAVGDCAETPDPNKPGKTFAPTAQNSTRAGAQVADNINHVLRGRRVQPFTYKQIGELAIVSSYDGVAHVFGVNITGPLAWLMWRVIYIAKMPGMPERFGLLRDYLLPSAGMKARRTAVPLPPRAQQTV